MLLLRILVDNQTLGKSYISCFSADELNDSELFSCWAEGIPYLVNASYPSSVTIHSHCRYVIDPSFQPDDVRIWGRYGLLEISDSKPDVNELDGARPRFYIAGGKTSEVNCGLVGLLRLSREDHRTLIQLVRRYGDPICETLPPETSAFGTAETPPPDRIEPQEQDISPLMRIRQLLPKLSLASAPFLIPFTSAAQCVSPASGQYDSGSNYSGVDFSHIINSDEGGTALNGYVPTSSSGVTIAGGLDLGTKTATDLSNMGIPSNLIQQFTPFLAYGPGHYRVGANATAALNQNPQAATITQPQADQINSLVYDYYSTNAASSFDNHSPNFMFTDLNVQWQTALVFHVLPVSRWYDWRSILAAGTKWQLECCTSRSRKWDWADSVAGGSCQKECRLS